MIIYLDIDGVMLKANSWQKPDILDDGFMRFNKSAVNSLNNILEKTSAHIVLISSHRNRYSEEKWIKLFKSRGVNIDKISLLSETGENRKSEILNHLGNNNINHFVIIDDDKSLNGLPNYLKDNLIQTFSGIGLTYELSKIAINKLLEND